MGPKAAQTKSRTQKPLINIARLRPSADAYDPEAFVTLLTGAEAPALALMDQEGFGAVIEAMTMGRLAARPTGPRRPTTTDAALLAEVIDATLAGLGAEDPLSGLRCGRPVADHRLLPVILEEIDYDLVALTAVVVSGSVTRPLRLMLALPRPDAAEVVASAEEPARDWSEALNAAVMRAPASLRAELGRVTLPLAEVLALGPGSSLTLPLSNLEEVQLVALDGAVQAVGRLGQTRGMRAVRLTGWPGGLPPSPMLDAAPPGRAMPAAAPLEDEEVAAPDFPMMAAMAPMALDLPEDET
ncbi:hypothetical protein DDE23_12035 [Pararhodobacter aggregans]|uniref:Flagellar motor switch protein FliN-like C-terminal domain-containing protein n=1 Tax=Pararhodobacter aggregans TaxID=404875 RepID=A0A2T7UQN3_9RHOB|nr:hypothetical protein DDE23_12035 [Pararhodobacter aggregans]